MIRPGAGDPTETDQFADVEGSLTGFFKIDDHGELHLYDGPETNNWLPTGTKFELDDAGNAKNWIRLSFRQDFENGLWDVAINGDIFRANLAMAQQADTLEKIEFIGQSKLPLVIDNIQVSRHATAFEDQDRDGLPDDWEADQDFERNADDDGDGLTNIEEWVAGTRPDQEDTNGDGILDGAVFGLGNLTEDDVKVALTLPLPLFTEGISTQEERKEIISQLRERKSPRTFISDALSTFTDRKPNSAFHLWLEANNALLDYESGRFTEALKRARRIQGRILASQADSVEEGEFLGSAKEALARIYIVVGEVELLGKLLDSIDSSRLQGTMTGAFGPLKQAHGFMRDNPERAYRCGLAALLQLRDVMGIRETDEKRLEEQAEAIRQFKSIQGKGLSFEMIQELGATLDLPLTAVQRSSNAAVLDEVPIPSIVHWKVGHFATIVAKTEEGYHIKDSSVERSWLVSPQVFVEESSGYFLVPSTLPESRDRGITPSQAGNIWGKGNCYTRDERNDPCPDKCQNNMGMPGYAFTRFSATLSISDTPAYYQNPFGQTEGPALTYTDNMRSHHWAYNFVLPNVGKQWTMSGLSYATKFYNDTDVTLVLPDGRKETFESIPGTGYERNPESQATLEIRHSPSFHYVRTTPDGTEMVYGRVILLFDGYYRFYQLTEINYPNGYAHDYTYDSLDRLIEIENSFGREVSFTYSGPYARRLHQIHVEGGSGNKTATLGYDSSNRLTSITDAEGMQTSFTHGGNLVTEMETPYSRKGLSAGNYKPTKFSRDFHSHGQSLMIEDPEGLKEVVAYDGGSYGVQGLGGVRTDGTAEPSEKPSVWQSEGFVNDFELNDGVSLYWSKNAIHHLEDEQATTITSPVGALAYGEYASQTHWLRLPNSGGDRATPVVSSTRSPLTFRTWYRYPGQPATYHVGTSTLPSHVISLVRAQNVPPTMTNPPSYLMEAKLEKYTYNTNGHVTWYRDPRNRQTTYEYHTNGIDLHKIKQWDGSYKTIARFENYTNGQPQDIYDAGGNHTHIDYTTYGRVQQVTDAEDHITEYTYASNGQLQEIARTTIPNNTNSFVTLMNVTQFDSFRRPTHVLDSDAYQVIRTYDKLDRTTLIEYPDGTDEQFFYDVGGTKYVELQKVIDRQGRHTVFDYNRNRQLTVVDDFQHINNTEYEWCACGDLKQLKDPKNQVTQWKRDWLGRVTEKIYPDNRKFIYTYEPESGALSTVKTPTNKGNGAYTHSRHYWPDGNLYKIDHVDSGTVDSTFEYSSNYDRLTKRTDTVAGSYTYQYTYGYHSVNGSTNGAGMLSSIDGPWSGIYDKVHYTYDDLGRIKTRKIDNSATPQEHTEQWNYDSLGRIHQWITGIGTFTNAYIGNSGLIDVTTYPNGQKADYDYHPHNAGRYLKKIENKRPNTSSTLSEFEYTFHHSGQIDQWTQKRPANKWGSAYSPRTYHHTYDNIDQLDTVTEKSGTVTTNSWNYDYDTAGNRSFRYKASGSNAGSDYFLTNNRNQLTFRFGIHGTYGVAYDPSGHMTSYSSSSDAKTFEWDAAGNLLAVVVQVGASPSANDTRTEFRYNGLGQRMEQIEFNRIGTGNNWNEVEHWYYVWADGQLLQKRTTSTSSTDTKTNYYAMGESRHTGTGAGSKSNYYYNLDHLGTVHEMTNAAGEAVAAYRYDSYGQREKQSFSTTDCEIGYTGHHHHEATGLVLTWFRAYDPEMGRWISPDPIGEAGGINIYAYVQNSPAIFFDPDGLLVKGVFDRKAGTLKLTDVDTGESVTTRCFSGGVYDRKKGVHHPVDGTEFEVNGPTPAGTYTIVDLPPGKAKPGWFGLFRNDGVFNDQTWGNPFDGKPTRGGFRLHGGTASKGCVTVPGKTSDEWKKVEDLLNKTKTIEGPRKKGEANRRIFGSLEVR